MILQTIFNIFIETEKIKDVACAGNFFQVSFFHFLCQNCLDRL